MATVFIEDICPKKKEKKKKKRKVKGLKMEDGLTEISGLVSYGGSKEEGTHVGEEEEEGDVGRESEEKEEQDNSGGGGVISNFISALVTKVDGEDEGEEKDGGLINQLLSNLVSPSSPKVAKDNDVCNGAEEKGSGVFSNLKSEGGEGGGDGRVAAEGGGGGGGGLIDNIVSHLPAPLADAAAPATDEASILIHSIVHD
ncbi:ubiquitin carboxyl-terminal hydrolase-related protein [Striga asiatica]|uniref:Ubiquitin carboxyl-terminal hydrolase-related protein n=1 Tax=Striga asiatica TaxID=4170 RepID=A0A5A7P1M8_STRAF|nr:ubiquitin carboxyl-terminal hydrolase-related protein [Striga asiatica]